MRIFLSCMMSLVCVLSVTGCMWGPASQSSAVQSASPLSGLPDEVELVYSHSSTQVSGAGVTTDPWGHGEDTGFWVLEFRCGSGVIKQVELRSAAGEAVASFGTIQEDGVFVTDLVTEAAGDYVLYFGKADSFSGEINVYFVPGIGYSVAD